MGTIRRECFRVVHSNPNLAKLELPANDRRDEVAAGVTQHATSNAGALETANGVPATGRRRSPSRRWRWPRVDDRGRRRVAPARARASMLHLPARLYQLDDYSLQKQGRRKFSRVSCCWSLVLKVVVPDTVTALLWLLLFWRSVLNFQGRA